MTNLVTQPTAKRDRYVTSSGEVFPSDDILSVATAGGAVTLTLPLAANVRGRVFEFNKTDNSSNTLTVQTQGSDTWDGGSSRVWSTQYQGYGIAAVEISPNVFGYATIYSYGDLNLPTLLTVVKKTANETIQSDVTLGDDDTLKFSVAANTKYFFRLTVLYDTGAAPDIQFRLNGPTSPTLVRYRFHAIGSSADSGYTVAQVFLAYTTTIVLAAGNNGGYLQIEGVLHNGANTGTLALQWAQNSSTASDTTVLAGSTLEYMQI